MGCLIGASAGQPAHAAFPERIIKIIVPQAPGGGTDAIARVLAQEMAKDLGGNIIIENKAGAGTIVGTLAVVSSEPDGHTLLMGTFASAVNSSLVARLPYDVHRDLAPVALVAVEDQVKASGLEHSLIELVKTRASQINGCAYCIDMHTTDARKAGETEQRLYLLNAWRESPLYSERERAALAWTEALTLIAETHAPDEDYEAMRAQFSESEAVNLTMLIGAINAWNRVAIGFRAIHPVKAKAAA